MRMAYEIRPGLHFCESGSRLVFLDLDRDRYFCLPPSTEDAFRTFIDPQLYSEVAIDALLRARIVRPAAAPHRPEPASVCPAVHSYEPTGPAKFARVLEAISIEMLFASRLRHSRLSRIIASLESRKQSRRPPTGRSDRKSREIIAAFSAAKLYRSPAGRCLSRSLALASQLAAHDHASTLVIGIRAEPFAAHCWVQAGDVVLNDTAEEANRYTPILVI